MSGDKPLTELAVCRTTTTAASDPFFTGRRRAGLFWSLLFLALALRVAAAWVIDQKVSSSGGRFLIEGDANGYWELGQRIAAGEEYAIHSPPRRILRTPGFPLLLAASILLFGDSVFAASLVMAVTGTACCWLTFRLAERLFDRGTAFCALLLTAISPLQIGSNVQILSETWFTFWVLLSLLSLVPVLWQSREGAAGLGSDRTGGAEGLWPGLQAGMVTGLGVLVRPGWILWPAVAAFLVQLAPGHQGLWRKIVLAGTICVGCWLALVPWAARNYGVSGHWIHTSLWSGPSLYDGLNPLATGSSDMRFLDDEQLYSKMSEYDVNQQYKRRSWQFVLANPARVMQLAYWKTLRYLSPTLQATGFSGGFFSIICVVWYGFFWTSLCAGAFKARSAPLKLALLAAPFLQFLLVHMVFVGSVRYRLPVEFPLSVICAHGLASLMQRFFAGFRPTVSAD